MTKRPSFSQLIEHERALYVDARGRPVEAAETFVSVGRPLEGLAPTVYEMAVRAMEPKMPVRAMEPKMPDAPADTLMVFYRAPLPWP